MRIRSLRFLPALLFLESVAHAGFLPEPRDWRTLPESAVLTQADRDELDQSRNVLLAEIASITTIAGEFDTACGDTEFVEGSPGAKDCAQRQSAIQKRIDEYLKYLAAYHARLDEEQKAYESWKKPMLVGGTTWTFGANLDCNAACNENVKQQLVKQFELYCKASANAAQWQCKELATAKDKTKLLPFDPDAYGVIVSVGSAHDPVLDLATRVLFDHVKFGEYSRDNKEAFANLKGKSVETLECHSNGAMVCLAALRAGDVSAKNVKLYGPQMSEEAAKRWGEIAKEKGMNVTVYVATGDPVLPASWTLPQTPKEAIEAVRTGVSIASKIAKSKPALVAAAGTGIAIKITGTEEEVVEGAKRIVGTAFFPKQTEDAKEKIKENGMAVVTLPCRGADASSIDLRCHSARRYQELAEKYDKGREMEIRDGRNVKPSP